MSLDVPALEALLVSLVEGTAARLEGRRLPRVNDRDHLQPDCSAEVVGLASAPGSRIGRASSHRLRLETWAPGNIDLPLVWDETYPVMLELKCGTGNDSLGPCAWDVAKCAAALHDGAAAAAYIVSGAPAVSWSRPVRGAEFFTSAEWSQAALRHPWRDWWRHWEKHGDPMPTALPRAFRSTAVATVPFHVADEVWQLRLARIDSVSSETIPWPSFLRTLADVTRDVADEWTARGMSFSLPPDTFGSGPGDAYETRFWEEVEHRARAEGLRWASSSESSSS